MKEGFIVPPDPVNFYAKKLFGNVGEIIDGSIAYGNLRGGGPAEKHTHSHNHLWSGVRPEFFLITGRS
jgi:hypothetical protein